MESSDDSVEILRIIISSSAGNTLCDYKIKWDIKKDNNKEETRDISKFVYAFIQMSRNFDNGGLQVASFENKDTKKMFYLSLKEDRNVFASVFFSLNDSNSNNTSNKVYIDSLLTKVLEKFLSSEYSGKMYRDLVKELFEGVTEDKVVIPKDIATSFKSFEKTLKAVVDSFVS